MLIIPAIDLRAGRVVRLLRGDYAAQTTYDRDPVATAREFLQAGAQRLHVVDLDAARGRPDLTSAAAMAAVVAAVAECGAEVEIGGGVRSLEAARSWIDRGASHVVLGSLALRDPDAAAAICAAVPGRVLLGLDVRGGEARAQGWTEGGGAALDHVRRWRDWAAAGIIYTDTERDGAMGGADTDGLRRVRAAYGGDVVASGGVASIEDLAACAAAGAAGAVVGRALYEGTVDLATAISRFSFEPSA